MVCVGTLLDLKQINEITQNDNMKIIKIFSKYILKNTFRTRFFSPSHFYFELTRFEAIFFIRDKLCTFTGIHQLIMKNTK